MIRALIFVAVLFTANLAFGQCADGTCTTPRAAVWQSDAAFMQRGPVRRRIQSRPVIRGVARARPLVWVGRALRRGFRRGCCH